MQTPGSTGTAVRASGGGAQDLGPLGPSAPDLGELHLPARTPATPRPEGSRRGGGARAVMQPALPRPAGPPQNTATSVECRPGALGAAPAPQGEAQWGLWQADSS